MPDEQIRQTGQHIIMLQGPGNFDRQTFPRELVDHRQHPEGPAIMGPVHDEVVCPDVIFPARPETNA
jgi:hypothetical protein